MIEANTTTEDSVGVRVMFENRGYPDNSIQWQSDALTVTGRTPKWYTLSVPRLPSSMLLSGSMLLYLTTRDRNVQLLEATFYPNAYDLVPESTAFEIDWKATGGAYKGGDIFIVSEGANSDARFYHDDVINVVGGGLLAFDASWVGSDDEEGNEIVFTEPVAVNVHLGSHPTHDPHWTSDAIFIDSYDTKRYSVVVPDIVPPSTSGSMFLSFSTRGRAILVTDAVFQQAA